MKITNVWVATKAAGLWYVTVYGLEGLFEAWAWEGQYEPPHTYNQRGYRFQQCGASPSGFDDEE